MSLYRSIALLIVLAMALPPLAGAAPGAQIAPGDPHDCCATDGPADTPAHAEHVGCGGDCAGECDACEQCATPALPSFCELIERPRPSWAKGPARPNSGGHLPRVEPRPPRLHA